MTVVALIPAVLAALVHVYIFVLESVLWTGPRARRIFGTTEEEAQVTRSLALNQGFYNLFLAIVTLCGVGALAAGSDGVGAALTLAGTGSMLAAALVLAVTSPDKRRAAVTQGLFPLITVVLLLIADLG
jgi:putative membrane protein